MSTLHIACQARADYVPHSAAMLHSVLANGGMNDVHVHYLHGDDVPATDLLKLRTMVEGHGGTITLQRVDESRVSGLTVTEQFPASHWYRLFLPELLPDLEKVLYLDADLIVVDSLRPLWETSIDGFALAAVTNVFQADHFGRVPMLGLDAPNDYFNSGVMLLNLARMRDEGATSAVLAWALANGEKLDWPEQDALNVVLGKQRLALHPRWNAMNSMRRFPWSMHAFGAHDLAEALDHPAVRHFEGPGPNKPWHILCDPESQRLYREHRRHTPWPHVRLEGVTAANVARRVQRAVAWRLRNRSFWRQSAT